MGSCTKPSARGICGELNILRISGIPPLEINTCNEIYDILNGNRVDIFGISESKISASFTNAQFNIPGYRLYRQDRDIKGNGGGIILYIKDHIPHRILR